jgi:glycyl-radical enzyme activating protein
MNVKTGIVLDILRGSLHDGPGIRTTVFLKGCPMHCRWCHNPESVLPEPEVALYSEKCTLCGACVEACPNGAHNISEDRHYFDRSKCNKSGKCVEACVYGALKMAGREMKDIDVLELILGDKAFYRESGGGVTLSGGEPMFQFGFTRSLLKRSRKEGIHTCLDTSGLAPTEHFREVLPYVDLFLYDIKATDPAVHKEVTGTSNDLVWTNFKYLYREKASIELRCPLIPGFNDQGTHLQELREIRVKYTDLQALTIMPYHNAGRSKYDRYGYSDPFPGHNSAGEEIIASWNSVINS